MIESEQREIIITAILQQLDAVHPSALTPAKLLIPLKLSGLGSLTAQEIASLMLDLEERGMVKPLDSETAREVTRYQRTDHARAFLRRNGF